MRREGLSEFSVLFFTFEEFEVLSNHTNCEYKPTY